MNELIYFKIFCFQLVLRENDLVSLPKEIGEINRLRELHVQGNRLTFLPPELGNDGLIVILTSKFSRIFEWWKKTLFLKKLNFHIFCLIV